MMLMILEACARTAALGLLASAALTWLRIRRPQPQKAAWTGVLLASLAMPALMRAVAAPLIKAPAQLLTVTPALGPPERLHAASHGLAALYALIAAALLFRQLLGLIRVQLIRRRAARLQEGWTQGLDVRVTDRLKSPATFGATILLPADHQTWDAAKRAAVMAHERSHVEEHDSHLLWLAQLNTCLFWVNPMAWWTRRRLAQLAEATADEAALAAVSDRPGYAQILLDFAHVGIMRSVTSMSSQSDVSARIERILAASGPAPAPAPMRRFLAFGAMLPVAIAIGALQLAPAPAVRADTPVAAAAQGPRIVNYGGLTHISDYYPPDAVKAGIEGQVQIAVTLDSQGRATDTLILAEEPAGQGFGAAASALAHTMTYSNPTGHPAQLIFNVTFALKPHTPAREDAAPATSG